MAIVVIFGVPALALIVLLGAPWWFAVASVLVATVGASYASFRSYQNPEDPGPLVRFLADPVGWFTDPD